MSFEVVIPVLNQFDRTAEYLKTWYEFASGAPKVHLINNGSDSDPVDHPGIRELFDRYDLTVHYLSENIGVYPTFEMGMKITKADWVFYSHSDVEMTEYGWDVKLARLLAQAPNAGVCGMFGAQGIGTIGIYEDPYNMFQLQRWGCITVAGMHDPKSNVVLPHPYEPVTVLDGFSLIVNRKMIEETGGFDHESFPPHHMYDNDICLQSHFGGYHNYVLDIDCIHHGGMTSCAESWAEKWKTSDQRVHREAHVVFYEKYKKGPDGKPMLPAHVKGVTPWLRLAVQ